MIHYLLIDSSGTVRRRGACGSHDEIPLVDGMTHEVIDSADARMPSLHVEVGHSFKRASEYPSIGDQLDAIWKAISPLIEHPEAEAILAKIQAVKDANPKP